MATIKDVAKHAGVSIATVSNVLNKTKPVSEALRERVEEAVETLNYRVDVIARNMKKKHTREIGVVLNSFNTIFIPQVVNGIQNYASERDYQLIFYCSDFDVEKEKRYVSMLLDNKVDGIIINSVASYKDEEYFSELANLYVGEKHVFVVSIERNLTNYGVHSVHVNNYLGGETATAYLIEKDCKRIAVVTGPRSLDIIHDRISGYRNALKKAGLPIESSLIVNGDYSTISGYLAVKRLLLNGVPFDGIFSCNDQMAVGVIKALKESGHRVPEDVKVIGFDNTFISSLLSPSLTTINVPKFRMGVMAASKVIGLIEKKKDVHRELASEIPINIVKRSTTDPDLNMGIELEW